MSVNDSLGDRRRAMEDEYFRKRDQELTEKARLQAQEDAARRQLAERSGIADAELLRTVQLLGYTAETVPLLRVMPLLEVAWADGSVSDAERQIIVAAARERGVEPGSTADVQLAEWLTNCPPEALRDGSLTVLHACMQTQTPDERSDLLAACSAVASASGGVFGFRKISDRERQMLDRISRDFGPLT